MTRVEEIRQAAHEYSDKLAVLCEGGNLFKNFCNGAKWADEHPQFVHTDNSQVIANLEAEIERLKSPWISVEDRMPDENSAVLVRGEIRDNGHADEFYVFLVENGEFVSAISGKPIWKLDTFRDYTFTHWMPIPELPKGGEV